MGCVPSSPSDDGTNYTVVVKTGDYKGAGTNANVYVILVNATGLKSREISLDVAWHDDFEAGKSDKFPVKNLKSFGEITELEVWRDGGDGLDTWFVELIKIMDKHTQKVYVFPVHRWVTSKHRLKLQQYDCVLPQNDKFQHQRKLELQIKKKLYAFTQKGDGLPCQVKEFPVYESFSNEYKWDITLNKAKLLIDAKIEGVISGSWESLDDLGNVYNSILPVPKGMHHWKSDYEFGMQRLTGCNPTVIKLCTHVPENFAVTNEMLQPILENMTIEQAIAKKVLFIVDYKILEDVPCKDKKKICSPLALFFVDKEKRLLPVAIQLFQKKADDNPVFLPTDNEYTWMFAKMWFNNADASYHQSATHLGLTHLFAESVTIATHNCLSQSHPLFRLMAPHFLYLIAINSRGLGKLVSKDGWVDRCMLIGRVGMFEIIKRSWESWRLDVNGTLPKELESRGVLDPELLPNYHYRDDALLLWNAILKYVSAVVSAHYDKPEKLSKDYELQEWHKMLSSPCKSGGVGIKGIPGEGAFKTWEQVAQTVTSIIYTDSVVHAAVNFCQYDNYGFPPHYPAYIKGEPPKNKEPKTEEDVLKSLPDKEQTLSVMVVTKLLSDKGTNSLGHFEVNYQYDPIGTKAVKKFQENLKAVGNTIKQRNNKRESAYTYLHPSEVPNAISI
ncbi:allene oxide synthase-lipoxygenase protein-like [Antedon mediterranea]|uniref:allene oxide synthase-lipoxygenase protein-like n=1 Tax=Antedon mediterranea TaxID=105859 RepID=UPI003AF9A4B0